MPPWARTRLSVPVSRRAALLKRFPSAGPPHRNSFASQQSEQNSLASLAHRSDGCRDSGNHPKRSNQMKKSKRQNQQTAEAAATTAQPQTPQPVAPKQPAVLEQGAQVAPAKGNPKKGASSKKNAPNA